MRKSLYFTLLIVCNHFTFQKAPNSTSSPTAAPIESSTSSPTATPVKSICNDSRLTFQVTNRRGNTRNRTCTWVSEKKGRRCAKKRFRLSCPSTCNSCGTCEDSMLSFKVMKPNGNEIIRRCNWAKKNTDIKCAFDGVSDTCRSTCKIC